MSEVEETAKAVQESAKLGQEVVKHLPEISEVGSKLLGPFGQGWGILTDLARHAREEIQWRLNNRRRVYEMAMEMLQEEDLIGDIQPVSPRIAFDVEAGLEREDVHELQKLWAALIANLCTDPSAHLPLKIVIDVLSRMDRDTAAFFNEVAIRREQVRRFFVVVSTVDGGTEIVGISYPGRDAPTSTALFRSQNTTRTDDVSFICPWPISKVELTVDALCSVGLLVRAPEPINATDMFESIEQSNPSESFAELGARLIESLETLETFGISELGGSFHDLVTRSSGQSGSSAT